ncbi:hypothetical protein DENSPDRAFT_839022 [Dentipellis sp. KUC8613]|nr:hypothetical protein DENSPDRAFT_839022 [Dentipellis sp. KUC8613]
MLVVHADSRCDVCLDPYSWETTEKTPHAIACGHIFCYACLQNLAAAICPLCRKAFNRDRVKRLHVDPQPSNNGEDDVEREAKNLVERLALASGEHTPQTDVRDVLEEVRRWLDDHGNAGESSETRFPSLRAAWAALVRYKDLQERHAQDKRELQDLTHRYKRLVNIREADKNDATIIENNLSEQVSVLERYVKLAAQDEELKGWHRQFPHYVAARSVYPPQPQHINVLAANPLPEPPRPFSYDYEYSKGERRSEPRQEQANSAYGRTSIPPLEPRPSNYGQPNGEKGHAGPGAIIVRGASHENRFFPPSNHPEHSRSRVLSDAHRDGRERSRHHRSTDAEREERRRRHRERDRERALREAREAEAADDEGDRTLVAPDAITPGNALGIDPSLAPPPPGDVMQRNASSSSRNPQGASEGYVYATHGGDRTHGQSAGAGANAMVRMGSAQGPGSATTSFNIVGRHEPRSDAPPPAPPAAATNPSEGAVQDAVRAPRMRQSSTSNSAGPVQWRPDGSSTSLAGLGLLNHPGPGPATTGLTFESARPSTSTDANAAHTGAYNPPAPTPNTNTNTNPAHTSRESVNSWTTWGNSVASADASRQSTNTNGSGFLPNLIGLGSPNPSTEALAGSNSAYPQQPGQLLGIGASIGGSSSADMTGATPTAAAFIPPHPHADERPRNVSFSSGESQSARRRDRRDSHPSRPGTSHADRASQFYLPPRPETRSGTRSRRPGHESQSSLPAAPYVGAPAGSREALPRATAPPVLTTDLQPGWPYAPAPQIYRSALTDSAASLASASAQSSHQRWVDSRAR